LVISFDIAHLAFGQNPHYASPVPILKQPAFRHDCLPKDVSYQSDQTKGQAAARELGQRLQCFSETKRQEYGPILRRDTEYPKPAQIRAFKVLNYN